MKQSRLLLLICAIALLLPSCTKENVPKQEVSATFTVDMPQTKALSDGALATELYVRVYDSEQNFLYEQKANKEATGWNVDLKLVPGTYSFSFWAQSAEADAFSFDGQYMTLSYNLMDMNSDTEDAFWAAVAGKEVSAPFTQRVTLKRPFAFIQIVSNSFINEPLEGATSSFTITGEVSTRMNLITGHTDEYARKAIFNAASLTEYTHGRMTIAAYAYLLVPDEGIPAATVNYNITFKDGRTIDGSVADVPLNGNFRTTLIDN